MEVKKKVRKHSIRDRTYCTAGCYADSGIMRQKCIGTPIFNFLYLRFRIISSFDLLKFPRKKLIDPLNSSEMSVLSSSCFLLDGQPVEFATSMCESREEVPAKILGQFYLAGNMYISLPSLSDRYLQNLGFKNPCLILLC